MIDLINIPHGTAFPLGATCYSEGVNFSLFSKHAEHVELWLFDRPEDATPSRILPMTSKENRTFYYWHIFVEGLKPGQLYGYKAFGKHNPEKGLRFDSGKLLLDPYARAVANFKNYDREQAKKEGDNTGCALKSVVIDPYGYDWENDQPIKRPYATTVIYELHVKGMTAHPNSGVSNDLRGTYKGLIEKIPYLQALGITAVELMPVQLFDPHDAMPGKRNYWGYSPIIFFAPHVGYSSQADPVAACNEFRDMVKAFHKAGIEVILDVVFNHTAEGDETGPVLSLKGLENKAYYMLEDQKHLYKNYTGCGNTLNANHSIVRRMILDCLRSWVTEYHIDGFRFDLASVLSRDEGGEPLENPPVLWEIESDPVLAGTKIIAEAWDAAGLYQVGSFIGDRWAEWNGKYRDDVRRFFKGDVDMVSKLASRIIGSPDIYTLPGREPNRGIHFVTCHDGFTLMDLVSYNQKHNYSNGEKNRDGSNENYSWNCGVEGETSQEQIATLRFKQMKNFIAITFLSQGTPMILMGDEVGRTQKGNNNAYCQDNELSWFDWSLVNRNAGLLRFTREMIRFSQEKEIFRIEDLLVIQEDVEEPHLSWHGVKLNKPDWGENSHSVAYSIHHPEANEQLYVMVNAFWKPLVFELPKLPPNSYWKQVVDTSRKSPEDILEPGKEKHVEDGKFKVQERSLIVLEARY